MLFLYTKSWVTSLNMWQTMLPHGSDWTRIAWFYSFTRHKAVHFRAKNKKYYIISTKRGGTVRTGCSVRRGLCSFTAGGLNCCSPLIHDSTWSACGIRLYSQCTPDRRQSVDYIKCDTDLELVPQGQYSQQKRRLQTHSAHFLFLHTSSYSLYSFYKSFTAVLFTAAPLLQQYLILSLYSSP